MGRQQRRDARHQIGGQISDLLPAATRRMVWLSDANADDASLNNAGPAQGFAHAVNADWNDWSAGALSQDDRPGLTGLQATISTAVSFGKDAEGFAFIEKFQRIPVGRQIDLSPAHRKRVEPPRDTSQERVIPGLLLGHIDDLPRQKGSDERWIRDVEVIRCDDDRSGPRKIVQSAHLDLGQQTRDDASAERRPIVKRDHGSCLEIRSKMNATSSSTLIVDVSRITASGAGFNGATARD